MIIKLLASICFAMSLISIFIGYTAALAVLPINLFLISITLIMNAFK